MFIALPTREVGADIADDASRLMESKSFREWLAILIASHLASPPIPVARYSPAMYDEIDFIKRPCMARKGGGGRRTFSLQQCTPKKGGRTDPLLTGNDF
jgi:hypothetical protein